MRPCPGCGAVFPDREGPTHRYLEASPGCWAAFGRLAERAASDLRFARLHGAVVDAYCVQHPGTPSPQTVRSLAVHLVALYLWLERDVPQGDLLAARGRVATLGKEGGIELSWLEPPASPGGVTVVDLEGVEDPQRYGERVREWALSSWEAWSPHHATVRGWAQSLQPRG